MDEATVVIVGAGPSGLALAVNLGRMNIKTFILERDLEVTEDPRGITINGDAVRIAYQLGIGDDLINTIGSDTGVLNYHGGTFRSSPFMTFDTGYDYLQQSVSNAINQFQPNFERTLRGVLEVLPSCELRFGCEVLDRIEDDAGILVQYMDKEGNEKSVKTSWLVGADGKRGVVRKKFLEPEGIVQEVGLYDHVSTWVAANFEILLPTPATHPKFPLWKLGYSPEEVYELFWPSGFHFCNDIKRPAISGRFGPKGSRSWRHEYSVEPGENIEDPIAHLWAQFGPWLEISGSSIASTLSGTTVTFPRDCVKVTRCRPFQFANKVVNRWFCRQTLLIGDAAHVFPPFGAQGIASGIRDAQALSWRLSILSRITMPAAAQKRMLTGWAHERRQVCDNATRLTKLNGSITNQRSTIIAFLFRNLVRLLWSVPILVQMITRNAIGDDFQYQDSPGVFALQKRGGGRKLPQIWVRSGKEKPVLSDAVLIRDMSRLTLVVILRNDEEADEKALAKLLEQTAVPEGGLSVESMVFLHINTKTTCSDKDSCLQMHYRPCSRQELLEEGIKPIIGYDEKTLSRQIGKSAKYVILRPDFYIHSVASNEKEFSGNGQEIARYFGLN